MVRGKDFCHRSSKQIHTHINIQTVYNVGRWQDVAGALTPVVGGVAQVFHDLLVELRLLLVAEMEEGEEKWRVE